MKNLLSLSPSLSLAILNSLSHPFLHLPHSCIRPCTSFSVVLYLLHIRCYIYILYDSNSSFYLHLPLSLSLSLSTPSLCISLSPSLSLSHYIPLATSPSPFLPMCTPSLYALPTLLYYKQILHSSAFFAYHFHGRLFTMACS